MKSKQQTQRRTITIARLPMRRPGQAEDPELTDDEKRIAWKFVFERTFMPILKGEVSIRDVITPGSGGWARIDAKYPNLTELSIEAQLGLVLLG